MEFGTLLIYVHFLSAGLQRALSASAADRQVSAVALGYVIAVTTSVMTLVLLCLFSYLTPRPGPIDDLTSRSPAWLFVLFASSGAAYSLVSFARFKGQALLPSYLFEPLSRLNLVVVLPVSMTWLETSSNVWEWLAIMAALVPIAAAGWYPPSTHPRPSHRSHGDSAYFRVGVSWLVLAAGASAGLQLLSKVVVSQQFSVQIPVLGYLLGSNLAAVVACSITLALSSEWRELRPAWGVGIAAGVLNVINFGALLLFLVDGKPSRIYTAGALSMLIPVVIAIAVKRDRTPTNREYAFFLLALLALVLQGIAQ